MHRRRWGVVVGAVVAALVAGGCIGTTDREDFDQVIQERGGGLTSSLPLDAVDAVTARLGVDDVALRSLVVTPLDQTVVLEARDPATPGNLDRYVTRGGEVDSVEPIRLSESDDLDAQTFPASGLALDRMEVMADAALAEFGRGDAYVTSLTATRAGQAEVAIYLSLESPRASGTARFSADGDLVEVVPA